MARHVGATPSLRTGRHGEPSRLGVSSKRGAFEGALVEGVVPALAAVVLASAAGCARSVIGAASAAAETTDGGGAPTATSPELGAQGKERDVCL